MTKPRGIVLDQYYTDSLLRMVLGNRYRRLSPALQTARALPKKDLLTTLVLFEKAYLSEPYWLPGFSAPMLRELESTGLIEWVPPRFYAASFAKIGKFHRMLSRAFGQSEIAEVRQTHLPLEISETGGLVFHKKDLADREEEGIAAEEARQSSEFAAQQLCYHLPIIQSSLRHLRLEIDDPIKYMLLPLITRDLLFLPSGLRLDLDGAPLTYAKWRESYRSFLSDFLRFPDTVEELLRDPLGFTDLDDADFEEAVGWTRQQLTLQNALFDSCVSSNGAALFASRNSLPLKCAGRTSRGNPDRILGCEAYELVRVQFKRVRYPVMESLSDVLRLREDPHLEAYRSVISEYSARMRSDLENERSKVLTEFRRDLELALRSLSSISKWDTTADICFWLSIPLAIIGALIHVPIGDLLLIPTTGIAKYVTAAKRKELDWLMFGTTSHSRHG
ncbi:hypothetical protein ACFL6M_02775 [Candidatus Eisenbacteria bacterium]|uniref:Letm1 RBD domain-containing protein n=1 Tax=Eiseniibacteriota bacterium TaxID=2212470 RepID=A0ABV6YJI8_UNCEI